MCIAIPSPGHRGGTAGWRWWRRLCASPIRLLGFSSALQLAGLALYSTLAASAEPLAAWLPALFVALGTLLLGISLTRIPQRLGVLPVSHPFLVVLFTLITTGGLLALLPSWTVAGRILAFIGWILALRDLWWKLKWAPRRLLRMVLIEFGIPVTVAAGLGGMLLSSL